jgi:acetylornithine/succinyldiaminopimelate/putrescine aminotransferase
MKALRERCTLMGAMLVLDEIQCGMGRTGKLFAFEHYDIVPDVLVLGKALGGGMPIGAVVASTEHMRNLSHSPFLGHISTFAGHPVACAGASAALDLYRAIDWKSIEAKGQQIHDILSNFSCVQEIRYKGLYFAIDLLDEHMVQRVVERCIQKGLITFWFLSCPWSFRIAPPLIISDEELSECMTILTEALAQEC